MQSHSSKVEIQKETPVVPKQEGPGPKAIHHDPEPHHMDCNLSLSDKKLQSEILFDLEEEEAPAQKIDREADQVKEQLLQIIATQKQQIQRLKTEQSSSSKVLSNCGIPSKILGINSSMARISELNT